MINNASDVDQWAYIALNQVLRTERKFRQRSLREVAKVIGISHSILARVENGSSATIENAIRILQWAEVPQASWGSILEETCKQRAKERQCHPSKPARK